MTTAIDWRPFFQSRAFTREQVQLLQKLFAQYAISVDDSAAPADAQFVVLATDSTLTAERVLTAGTGIGLADGGAGAAVTISNTDTGSTAVTTHEAAPNPHPQYLTATEGNAAYQPLSSVLTAYAGGDTPSAFTLGIVDSADAAAWRTAIGAGTGNGSVTSVGLTAPAAGITVSGSPVTGAGSMTLALSDDLAAVEGIATTGYVRRTAENTWDTVASIPNTDITGLGTMSTQNANAVAITGGTINGTNIGATTPGTGAFTTISATGNVTLGDASGDTVTVAGSLTLSNHSIYLPKTTSSTSGVIYKGGARFLHNFCHPTGDTAEPLGRNVFVGEGAGNFTMGSTATSASHGSLNVAVGFRSGYSNTTGYSNTFSGYVAGYYNTTGYANTFSGYAAGYSNTTGYANTFSGYVAGYANTTGYANTFSGYYAGYSNTTGYANTFSGYVAGRYINSGAALETATYSTLIGNDTRASADGNSYETVIGAGGRGNGSNTVTLGRIASDVVHAGRLVLNTTTTPLALDTNGQLTFTATSDTNVRISYRGSDGVTRVGNITLA